MFYDGNAEEEPGAVVCRVAPSFIRFRKFENLYAYMHTYTHIYIHTAVVRDMFYDGNAEEEPGAVIPEFLFYTHTNTYIHI
jgi:uncharacterized protein YdiU (UPF0061 family)